MVTRRIADNAKTLVDKIQAVSQTAKDDVKGEIVSTGDKLLDEIVGMMKAMLATLQGNDQMNQLRTLNAQAGMSGSTLQDIVRRGDAVGLATEKASQTISDTLQKLAHHFIFIQAGQVEEKNDGLTVVDVEKKLTKLSDDLSNVTKSLIEASTAGTHLSFSFPDVS